jgi:RNA polymerase sigma factor (TIGR02999 family)
MPVVSSSTRAILPDIALSRRDARGHHRSGAACQSLRIRVRLKQLTPSPSYKEAKVSGSDISQILQQGIDDPDSRKQLFTLIYNDLRKRAGQILAAHNNPSLSATALVHEVYLKLVDSPLAAQSKEHFFRLASQAMRQIMIDHARHRHYQKRDRRQEVSLNDEIAPQDAPIFSDLLTLDQALKRLHAEDADLADLVNLHFFGGRSFNEIADIQKVSLSTVERNWRTARNMLYRYMK